MDNRRMRRRSMSVPRVLGLQAKEAAAKAKLESSAEVCGPLVPQA
jgi:hypothetical protein